MSTHKTTDDDSTMFTMLSPIWESLGSLFLVFTKLNALLSSSSWSGFHLNHQDKSTLKLSRSTYECCRLSTYEYCRLRGNSPALNVVRGFKLSTYECCRLRHPDQDQALGIQAQPTGPELGRNIYHWFVICHPIPNHRWWPKRSYSISHRSQNERLAYFSSGLWDNMVCSRCFIIILIIIQVELQ